MSRKSAMPKAARAGRQRGYVLLLVMFLVATMMIFAVVAAPRVLTQGRRAKEDELIWRGEQYERAIRLYFRKVGRFPTSLDDLSKGANGLHFLRKPYKDPINPSGDWRLIYVTPAGMLVGSLRYHTLAELTAAQMRFTGGPPLPPSTPGVLGGGGASSQGPSTSGAGGTATATPTAPTAPGASPDQSQQTPQGQPTQPGQQPQPGQPSSSGAPSGGTEEQGPVIGGNIIGVASKVNKPSLKVYQGGKTYREWEFIWNPMAQTAVAVQPGVTPNQPGQGRPGPSPFGLNPQNPVPNMPQPPQPQNPPQ